MFAPQLTRFVAPALLAVLSACTPHSAQMTPTLSPGSNATSLKGTVAYRDRSALPPDAVVEVWLSDVTPGLMLTMALVGQTTVDPAGRQVPIPFELTYDPARIEATHLYGVKAVIKQRGGAMLYETPTDTKVITQGNPSTVALMLARVLTAPVTASLEGTSWRLEDLGGGGIVDNSMATIEFLAGGKVAGRATCNRYTGPVTITGASLSFGPMASTRMACAPALDDQEMKFLKALSEATGYEISGEMLLIRYSGSTKPLRFMRAGM